MTDATPSTSDDAIADCMLCRCEAVSARQVEQAIIEWNCRDANAVKKLTRAGMGYCQGKVCATLVHRMLHRLAGQEAACVPLLSRVPVRGVAIHQLAKACADEQIKPKRVSGALLFGDNQP